MKKTVTLLAIMILLVTNLLSCCLLKRDDGSSDRENVGVNENEGNNEEGDNDSESPCVHSWVKDEAKEPSCTELGLTEGVHCSACGEVLVAQAAIPAMGHTEVIDETIEATCTTEGLTEGKHCSACGETTIKQETLAAKGHTLTTFSAKAVSCARSGWAEYESCEICDYSTYEEISALGHEYQDGFCVKCDEPKPSEGLSYTLSEDATYYIVSGLGSCTDTKVVIPGIYNGLPVTEIGEYAFYQCKHITDLTICNGITYVNDTAFQGCHQLKRVTFPASMESTSGFWGLMLDSVYIKDMTAWCNAKHTSSFFSDETKLYLNNELVTALTIPEGVTKINNYAFYNYTGLTSVILPNGVTEIGAYAFSTCTNLTSISIPDNVTKIGNSAFLTCKNLETVKFGKGIETIGGHAFLYSDGIKNVYISDLAKWCSITYNSVHAQIGNSSTSLNLYVNEELVTNLIIPEGVTSIGDFAFRGIDSIESVTIPEGVKSIGKFAFFDCDNLIDIKIADSVEIIDLKAFNSCDKLKEITLGRGMKSIEYYAFNYCPALCNIYYTGTPSEWCNISICMIDSSLDNAKYYFYSECETEGNFWHYVDDIPTIWK